MRPVPLLSTGFDRINRYRLAAVVLVIPFLMSILSMDLHWVAIPPIARRAVYWIGLFILLVAVAIDTIDVYSGRHKVKKMIRQQLKEK